MQTQTNFAEWGAGITIGINLGAGYVFSMNFNSDGYLPAGLHKSDLSEMETYLVDGFPHSIRRPVVFEGYTRHTADLQTIDVPVSQFVGGSFVSAKDDPSDVDLLGMGEQTAIDALAPADLNRLAQLFQGPGSKAAYECDAYFLASFPDTDPAFPHFRAQRKYWMGEFGFDRIDKPKGILTIEVIPNSISRKSIVTGTS